ncbi:MAG: efflux RND transporter periplasmic adaptor subunit [Rhodospirillales bacterium]|nr:efflux RND transporter periplasmic adaptor subunit [Rhodospirillales bacterium]
MARVSTAALALSCLLASPIAALAQGVVPVTATTVTQGKLAIELSNIGTVQAWQSVVVRTRVNGTLERVFFKEGQEVQPGDKLAEIDPRPYQAALDAATAKKAQDEAVLANAIRDLARYASLAKRDFASRQQLDTQQALVAQTRAAIEGDDAAVAAARINLGYTMITAPIPGRVGLRIVDPGNVVQTTDANGIVTIAQDHPIAVVFALPQQDIPAIHAAMARSAAAGTRAEVDAYASDDRTLLARGGLMTMDNAIDPATGTIRLKAEFANSDNALTPGQFVQARLVVRTEPAALSVPSAAVERGVDGLFVFRVAANDTAQVVKVRVGQDNGQVAQILSGLAKGDRVVVNGQSRLTAGTRVSVVMAKAGS